MSESIQPFSHRVSPFNKEIDTGQSKKVITKIEKYASQMSEQGMFSGGILIAIGEEIVFQTYHSLDQSPFDEHTLFNSCSTSKLFTALAIHQLAKGEHPTIHLDDKMGNLALEGIDVHEMKDVTIRELLNHTSGIIDMDAEHHKVDPSLQGTFQYSNYGYQLLAEIIKQKSPHGSFHEHVRKEILEKAHMEDALALSAQFDPKIPSFVSPRDYPMFEQHLENERQSIQNEIEKLELDEGIEVQNVKKGLEKKLKQHDLPAHYKQQISGEYMPESSATPPAGNGCFNISTKDWLKFSSSLAHGILPMEALQLFPTPNVLAPPHLNMEYCAGFERQPTKDQQGIILSKNGDSLGSSSSFKMILYPNQKPITIIVNSNIGESRGNIIADEILTLVEGGEIEHPLHGLVMAQELYNTLITSSDPSAELGKMHGLPPDLLLSISLLLAENEKDDVALLFLGNNTPLPKERHGELCDRLGDIFLHKGEVDTQSKNKKYLHLAIEMFDRSLQHIPINESSQELIMHITSKKNHAQALI